MSQNYAETGLSVLQKVIQRMTTVAVATAKGGSSLISISKPARVEPITLVDVRLRHQPYLGDALNVLSSIFIGYYLQAVSLSVKIGRVNTLKLLDNLNPNRDLGHAIGEYQDQIVGATVSKESFEYALPLPGLPNIGLEDIKEDLTGKPPGKKEGKKDDKKEEPLSFGNKVNTMLNEATNLSVGKVVEITIEDEGVKAVLPISFRLMTSMTDPSVLLHILADNSRSSNTFMERIHGWRSGQLEFWRDLVLCQDLINEHRKALLKDDGDVYGTILRRKNQNAMTAALTGRPSMATASNLLLMSSDTAKEVERELAGKFSSYNVRQRVFDTTYLMLIMIIDTGWESVTIYTNGISMGTQLPIKELKGANKGNGPDVAEILKAYQLGNAPTI